MAIIPHANLLHKVLAGYKECLISKDMFSHINGKNVLALQQTDDLREHDQFQIRTLRMSGVVSDTAGLMIYTKIEAGILAVRSCSNDEWG